MQTDLEKWIAPKFLYLSGQGHPRELTEDYLNSLISTKTRPCKSPILKIEQKEAQFLILPVPRKQKITRKWVGNSEVAVYPLVTAQSKPLPLLHKTKYALWKY